MHAGAPWAPAFTTSTAEGMRSGTSNVGSTRTTARCATRCVGMSRSVHVVTPMPADPAQYEW